MSLLKVRTKESYFERIQTLAKGTQLLTKFAVNNFENFSMEKFGKVNIIPDIKSSPDEQVFDTLQMWINWASPSISPRTLQNRFHSIKNYLHYMGIKLHPLDIKQELTFPSFIEEELHGLTLEEIQMIVGTLQYKSKAMIICQLSALMRVGELVQLRKRHVTDLGSNMMIKIPTSIAKFNKARTTFWSKEATKLIRPKLKRIGDDDLIFQRNENSHNAVIAIEQVLRRAIIRVGLDKRYESTGRFLINTHSLRAYGITKLSRHDENFTKKISGQKGYLLQYDRLSDEEKLKLYQKYEIDLLIDHDAIQKATIAKLQTVNHLGVTLDQIKQIIKLEMTKQSIDSSQ